MYIFSKVFSYSLHCNGGTAEKKYAWIAVYIDSLWFWQAVLCKHCCPGKSGLGYLGDVASTGKKMDNKEAWVSTSPWIKLMAASNHHASLAVKFQFALLLAALRDAVPGTLVLWRVGLRASSLIACYFSAPPCFKSVSGSSHLPLTISCVLVHKISLLTSWNKQEI